MPLRSLFRLAFVLALTMSAFAFDYNQAPAQSPTGFDVHETFLDFYHRSGGLPVFGYAVSAPQTIDGRLLQYFERQRFEHHPEHGGSPYEVQLGLLGTEEAERRKLFGHHAFAPLDATTIADNNCLFFAETRHRVCHGFKGYWERFGLDFGDAGVSHRESVALFGYPISEEFVDPDSGLITQYFERARFEYHPEHAGTEFEILLGHVGVNDSVRTGAEPPVTSLSELVRRAAPGATVTVPPGIYRETVHIDKPIELRALPGAEIRGSDVWTVWSRSGGHWVSDQKLPHFDNDFGVCISGDSCKWQEQVFVNGHELTQVESNPGFNEFALTGDRRVLIGQDPQERVLEVTTREHWIVGQSANVTIDGFSMRHAANRAQTGALSNNGYDNWTVRNSELAQAHGSNVSLNQARNLIVENNDINRGGQFGLTSFQSTDLRVEGNRIYSNNTAGYLPTWEAGGLKIATSTDALFSGNEVFDNLGPGLWSDIDSRNISYLNNRVHHNTHSGILFEISDGATIIGNRVWENGRALDLGPLRAGIFIQNSKNAEVADNIVAWNGMGISVFSEDRGVARWNDIRGNLVRDNEIFVSSNGQWDQHALIWQEYQWRGGMTSSDANNRGMNNRYYHANPDLASPNTFLWGDREFAWHELVHFSATPGENNGTVINEDEKVQILNDAGIPLNPEYGGS